MEQDLPEQAGHLADREAAQSSISFRSKAARSCVQM
jgi:hypothetical protein